MNRLRTLAIILLVCILHAGRSHADHLVVSRPAHVKAQALRHAEILLEASPGDALQLADDRQVDGYYKVRLADRRTGWVYRTLVRRWPGDLPGWDKDGPRRPDAEAFDAGRSIAYAGFPVQTNPNFPVVTLEKLGFVVGYCDDRMNPLWVAYAIGPATDFNAYPRPRRFKTDLDTKAKVTHDDYTNSGYSRGHMAPKFALQSRLGKEASDATFIMSNVCPQYQTHNDGPWGDLEVLIAGSNQGGRFRPGWADVYEHVWVIVGPIFDDTTTPLDSGVEVPSAFYCIVVDVDAGRPRALAFLLEHEDTRAMDLTGCLTSIRVIEARTGLDFMRELPDALENALETAAATTLWDIPE